MIQRLLKSTLIRLLLAVVVGLVIGPHLGEEVIGVVVTAKYILSQLIFFFIPLIVFSFVGSSITKMGQIASRLLWIAILAAYLSSVGAAFMAMGLGYFTIPHFTFDSIAENIRELPTLLFELNIPPVMSVMTALALAIMVGLASIWSRATTTIKLLDELQRIVLQLINKILIPILPLFIAANFCALSYEGAIINKLPIFLNVMAIVLVAHFVWLAILYLVAALVSGKNSWEVARHYAPPYFTAIGTMSSAATLPVSLETAHRSTILKRSSVDFGIPLFSNIHLCGSILTEVFFVMTVSKIMYGTLPSPQTMTLFILLLGIFAIGAPGVPGGTVIASLGIVTSIVGFDEAGTALLIAIFALQDSFGTACNVVGDGALTLIISRWDSSETTQGKS